MDFMSAQHELLIRPSSYPFITPSIKWYSVRTRGQLPAARVGHSVVYVRSENPDHPGCVYCIGGAQPDGAFNDAFVLDLGSSVWTKLLPPACEGTQLLPRYEHATALVRTPTLGTMLAAASTSETREQLYVFGGASEEGNRNDIQVLDVRRGDGWWRTIRAVGDAPSPRTHHSGVVVRGELLVVWCGGDQGSNPVADVHMHTYNIRENRWSVVQDSGVVPPPRLGHVMVAIDNKVYIHGGLRDQEYYDDLFSFDMSSMAWSKIKAVGTVPCARAAHSGVAASDGTFYIFGGLCKEGVLNDLHWYRPGTQQWTSLHSTNTVPAARLDFAMCLLEIPQRSQSSPRLRPAGKKMSEQAKKVETPPKPTIKLLLVHGGMDTSGSFYHDLHIARVDV